MVGQAVQGIRDKVFIATKVSSGNLRYDDVMRAAERSLRRLAVEYVDLYQIHGPNAGVPVKEPMKAMEALVDSGMVKHIGVSNFSVGKMQEAMAAMTKYPIVSNQVLYNLKRRGIERDLLPFCQSNHITVIAYTPLASGSLVRGSWFRRDSSIQALEQVSAQVSKTEVQVALNWCTSRQNVIVIPKSNNVARTEENCGASGWRLAPEQVRYLDEAFPK